MMAIKFIPQEFFYVPDFQFISWLNQFHWLAKRKKSTCFRIAFSNALRGSEFMFLLYKNPVGLLPEGHLATCSRWSHAEKIKRDF
jgi:hypothetical protein